MEKNPIPFLRGKGRTQILKYSVADPGRIIAQPAFGPSPSKDIFCDAIDGDGDEYRQTKRENIPAVNAWTPASDGGGCKDRKSENSQGLKRFGRTGQETERTQSEQTTFVRCREPAESLVAKMLMHPKGDRSVDQRGRGIDQESACRG